MNALQHIRIAVTRPAAQAEELAQPLRAAGAEVLIAPLIRISPTPLDGALAAAARDAAAYDWLVFSSVNGVQLFLRALDAVGVTTDALQDVSVACVGPATAEAAAQGGLRTAVMPEKFVGDAIVGALSAHGVLAGKRILLARAGGARAVLADGLRARGALVDDVEVYRSVHDESGAARLRRALEAVELDVVTFTSSSAVQAFAERIGQPGAVRVAVIGPVTAQTARECGIEVAVEADPHTVQGLVKALDGYFSAEPGVSED
ncbi:MAG TPA: uroporphyrinogen-III synthase [Longimicrobiales bacterium]